MLRFINAVRLSLKTENWYSALFVALSLPDICGRIEHPTSNSKDRYIAWFSKYLSSIYTGLPDCPFLIPEDCYALRCALVHEGCSDLDNQKAREILDEVCFLSPTSQGFGPFRPGHCNRLTNVRVNDRQFNDALCLDVSRFCEDTCQAVEKWLADVAGNHDVRDRMSGLLSIH